MSFIDALLNRVTMYRLVLYYLITLVVVALGFGAAGVISQSPINLAFSTLLALAGGWIANVVFAKVFRAQPNVESVYITALILALIITPPAPNDLIGIGFVLFASAWAMASKYILAYKNRHVFNPAAFGVALSALVIGHAATWWVSGTVLMLPFVVGGGLLIVRKIRRFDLVIAFTVVSLATIALTSTGDPFFALQMTLTKSAFPFLALVMLTEPLTMPPSRGMRIAYGALVGLLFAPQVHLGSFYFTPELALLAGNLFVALVSPKGRLALTLREKRALADHTYEFAFTSDRPLAFRPGQYLEWTLGHAGADSRGNRRYFTIASAPAEEALRLGVRFGTPASSFKRALGAMREGDTLTASHLAGDFTLPKNPRRKLAFIAGGIGITPFRSMVQHLVDTRDARPVTLLYANRTAADVAYADVFEAARRAIGMQTVYVLTDEEKPVPGAVSGRIDAELIAREIPDYRERLFYISGPHGMVEAFRSILGDLGVHRANIKTDYFPGF